MEIIHIVLGKCNPNRMNGVNKVVYQLATHQHEYGLNVSVWGITKDTINNYGERVFKTKLFKKEINPFRANQDLLQALVSKKGKAIFHIHGGWVPVFHQIACFLSKYGINYVYTPHGAYNNIAMKRSRVIKKIYFKLFEKNILKHASKVHCIGQSEIAGLNTIFKTNNTVLLPYGFQSNLPLSSIGSSTQQMTIGFVGRLDIYTKGLDLLIDAFEDFQKEVPESRLWIIGDGPEKSQLMKIIERKGLRKQVILFGSKFGDDKDTLIQQMHVFAHPSRNEGLPASILEACHFGIPCIVSEATNVAQYIRDYRAGIAVENDDKTSLKNAFVRMHGMWLDNSLEKMKHNAQQMVKEAFSWNHLIEKFNQLYSV